MAQAQRTWLETFEHDPPTEFPLTLTWQSRAYGQQAGTFDTSEMFRACVEFAKSRLSDAQRAAINEEPTRDKALTALWQQCSAEDFVEKQRGREVAYKGRSDRMHAYHDRKAQEREERQRKTWQRIQDDARELFDEI